MSAFTHPVAVTVKRSGGKDRYGDPLPGPPPHTVEGCAVYPRTSTETATGGTTVITGRTLLAPIGADILPEDQITLPDGTVWSVEGDVGPWSSPFTGWSPGLEVNLERVKGA
ncbi:hypothetical protein [Streptomonospora wellingtoniae]|uniref:Head-to-tail stopper n=1 Tax=Streptomonospora wellingtoniae TaxID=3075544 RepID=A0ABU2KV21_9ACTN|nr:hypothetical protein [Streptomonospora sp. DSM 45055]MDT0302903.1 hypothetical protein [Streptomonospora sp. DSM 45055]